MLWIFYNVLFAAAFVLMLPRFFFRMWRRGGYGRNFLHRFGIYDQALAARIGSCSRTWIHAVSVGELFVALKVIEEVRKKFPGAAFLVSTTTSTGYALAERRLDPRDVLVYFPVDFPVVVNRILKIVRPRAVILTECELWPNLIRIAAGAGIPVILVNGRISDSSYRGYMKIRFFIRKVLGLMDVFLVQSAHDSARLAGMGAEPGRIHVTGSVKYDMAEAEQGGVDAARTFLRESGIGDECRLIVGGSTWPGEEDALLEAYAVLKKKFPDLKLVLVPRHAERRGEVESAIARHGFVWTRKSSCSGSRSGSEPDVALIDTTGELKNFYALASVVFVGKSLCSKGGQNFIEPALFSKPIITGPHLGNFPVVSDEFLESGALVQVQDAVGLENALEKFLSDPVAAETAGKRAGLLVRLKKGAVGRSIEIIAGSVKGVFSS